MKASTLAMPKLAANEKADNNMNTRHSSNMATALTALLITIITTYSMADNSQLTLNLSGKISERCAIEINPQQNQTFKNMSLIGKDKIVQQAAFNIDCNSPMNIKLRSLRGALMNTDLGQGANIKNQHRDKQSYLPYQLKLNISKLNFSIQANSEQLFQRKTYSTGHKVPFVTTGVLKIILANQTLAAGQYEDTLHLEVSRGQGHGGI